MIFKLYDCDVGITLNGVNYDFLHVDEVIYDDPRRTTLTRGANRGDNVGIPYTEGIKEPVTITCTILGIPMELHKLLREAHEKKTRMSHYVVSRTDGSAKEAKDAILSLYPQQLTLNETPDSMALTLTFVSYNVTEVHKSDA